MKKRVHQVQKKGRKKIKITGIENTGHRE
jgi:hypothetical protein